MRRGRRRDPQHLRRPRGRRPRRATRRVSARVHRRHPGLAPPPAPAGRRRRRRHRQRHRVHDDRRPEPVEAGRRVPGLAGHAGPGLRRVRQLRQPHGGDAGAADRVRVGSRGERPPVPMVHERQLRPRRRRPGRDAAGVQGRGGGGAVPRDGVVSPGAGAAAPGRGLLPDPQRVELDVRERGRRRAHGVLAGLLGPVHQLQVRQRGVGRRRPAGAGGGEGAGRHARQEGDGERGDAEERGQVEGGGGGCCRPRRLVAREPAEHGESAQPPTQCNSSDARSRAQRPVVTIDRNHEAPIVDDRWASKI